MSQPTETVARPGDVQTTIDDVHDTGGGTVRLDAAATYEVEETLHLRPDVTLDCNGAIFVPVGDADLLHVHPNATVLQPRTHVPSIEWDHAVFTFDAKYGGYHPNWHSSVERYAGSGVVGGYTSGVDTREEPNGATAFRVRNGDDSEGPMTWLQCAHHQTYFVDTVVDLYSHGPREWINGNFFGGMHWMHRVGVVTRGDGKVNGNNFYFPQTQPDRYSEYLWDMQIGRSNTLKGMFWDCHFYDALLRTTEGEKDDEPHNNLVWTQGMDTEVVAEGDLGENFVLTNASFASLSMENVETRDEDDAQI